MFFKKKKISKKRNIIPFFLSLSGGIATFFLGIILVNAMSGSYFKVFDFNSRFASIAAITENFQNQESNTNPEEAQDEENFYILLTGRGGGNHDAPDLTDTMILAGFNPKNESITLFSIPRDLYVDYPGNTRKQGKLNGVYEYYLSQGEDIAMTMLRQKITEITGKEIRHHINIDFQGFIEVVNALGGVEVTLENNFVDYEYPDGNLGYKTFILRKGTWTLDGEVALMYARSRHSSSDFDRSLRQQEIISAIKTKVSELGYLKDRKKILELYEIFNTYIETDMGLTEMLKLGLELKSWENTKMLSFNLNDSCYYGSDSCSSGGLLYVPLREYFGGASVLLPNGANVNNLGEYSDIQRFAHYIYDYPEVYSNPLNISIYNASGVGGLAGTLSENLKAYGIVVPYDKLGNLSSSSILTETSYINYINLENYHPIQYILNDFLEGYDSQSRDAVEFENMGDSVEIILLQGVTFK